MSRGAPSTHAARLQLVLAAALFSTGGAGVKATTLSSWQIGGLRSLVAAVAVAVMLPVARRGLGLRPLLLGLGYACTLVLFVSANKLTTSANTIYLQSTAPLYVLLAGPVLLKERLRRTDLWFLALAALGLVCFFVGREAPSVTAPDPVRGNVLALLSGVTWAFTIMGLRYLSSRPGARPGEVEASVVLGNFIAFLLCSPGLLPLTLGTQDGLVLLYLGVFQVGLAYALTTRAVRSLPALDTSLLLLVEPVLNPVWAYFWHHEVPGPWAWAGAALVLLGTGGKAVYDATRQPARG